MRAIVLLFKPNNPTPEQFELTKQPGLDWYKDKLDGGWIEHVPGFNSIRIGEEVKNCVAFCDEEGKLKSLDYNRAATIAWNDALPGGLGTPPLDVLVGPVLVVAGDAEFMREV